MYLDTQIHAFPLVIFLGVGLLDQNCFPKWLYHVTLSPAVCDSSHWLGPLALGPSWAAIKTGAMVSCLIYFLDTPVVSLVNFRNSDRYRGSSHCDLNFHLPHYK